MAKGATVRGLTQLERSLSLLERIADPPISNQALMQGGLVIERAAKENITSQKLIDTGKMRASVAAWVQSANLVRIATRTFYAIFHEFGTRFIKMKAFLRPAVDKNEGEIAEAIGVFLWDEVKKIAK